MVVALCALGKLRSDYPRCLNDRCMMCLDWVLLSRHIKPYSFSLRAGGFSRITLLRMSDRAAANLHEANECYSLYTAQTIMIFLSYIMSHLMYLRAICMDTDCGYTGFLV